MLSKILKKIQNTSPQTLLPILLFVTLYQLALLDYICTIIALVIFVILSYFMYCCYLDKMPDYFFMWTVSSIVACYSIFMMGTYVLSLSLEGTLVVSCCVFLLWAFIDKIRAVSARYQASNLPSGSIQKRVNFCPECQFYCPKRPNHQYWLGTCIFSQNRIYYVLLLVLLAFTSMVSGYLTLNEICEIEAYGFYNFKMCQGIYYFMDTTMFFVNAMYTWLITPFVLYKIMLLGVRELTNFKV